MEGHAALFAIHGSGSGLVWSNTMKSLETLLAKIPRSAQARLVSNGVACWIVYPQPLSVSFFQSLSDMGGWMLAEEDKHCLWFFPQSTVMLGLGRLHNWARLNPITAAVTLFEASLVVGENFSFSLAVKDEQNKLGVEYPKRLMIRVTPHLRELGRSMPGLDFKQSQMQDGLAGKWFDMESSEQVSVPASTSWFWIIKPIGSRQDKGFGKGWRLYLDRMEALLQQNKIMFMYGEDHTLILKVSSLRTLGRLTEDLMLMAMDKHGGAWPCTYMAMELGDVSFTPDLPRKYQHLMEALEANVLYMPLTTIFQVASPRIVPVDSRYSISHNKIADLFQVKILSQQGGRRQGSLNILLPTALVSGPESPCFYCGLRSHLPRSCPTRKFDVARLSVSRLDRLALLNMDDLPRILQELGTHLGENLIQGIAAVLDERNDLSTALGAVFEVNMICQLRTMSLVWRAKGKAWPHGLNDLKDKDDDLMWSALDSLRIGNMERALSQVEQFILKAQKNYQPRLLQGFLAMERDECKRALGYWREAESLSYTSLQRSYAQLLQGRLAEVQGNFQEALFLYAKALGESPGFLQARYRQAVCLVKSGFLAEAQGMLRDLIQSDPNYFSIILLDPELEGGRTTILSDLWDVWADAQERAAETIGSVENLPDLLATWLPSGHEQYQYFYKRITSLDMYTGINNFVASARLVRGTLAIRDEIRAWVKKDIKELGEQRTKILDRLQEIQREASWFPFPRLQRSFNQIFNHCVEQVQVTGEMDLHVPEKFRKAHEAMHEAQTGLEKLERKLVFLQSIRNSILFMLLSGKYLLLFELGALVLSGLVSFVLLYALPQQSFFGYNLRKNPWQILNLSLIFFSFLAVLCTVLRAVSQFDTYMNKVLDKKKS